MVSGGASSVRAGGECDRSAAWELTFVMSTPQTTAIRWRTKGCAASLPRNGAPAQGPAPLVAFADRGLPACVVAALSIIAMISSTFL
jgi:hypothetical protein